MLKTRITTVNCASTSAQIKYLANRVIPKTSISPVSSFQPLPHPRYPRLVAEVKRMEHIKKRIVVYGSLKTNPCSLLMKS